MIQGSKCLKKEERGPRWVDGCSQERLTRDSTWVVFQEEMDSGKILSSGSQEDSYSASRNRDRGENMVPL